MEGKTVLIVDDDLAFCELLTEILQSEGVTVVVEHDGISGVAKALELHPDLVMFDVMMPRMTGIAALQQLRNDPWGKNAVAVLLTNVNQPEAMAASMENGPATEYLLKVDWTLEQIAERIKKILAKSV